MEGSGLQPREDGNPQRRDPSQLRVSDADRNNVAEVLRRAAGDGRLDFDELDQRLDATFAAKTYADLVPITLDLPAHPHHQPSPALSPAGRRSVAPVDTSHANSWVVMGECKRQGAWLVPAEHTAFALMGSVILDLREATFASNHITINASAIMGEVRVLVDAHTHVVIDGTPIMGEFSQGKDKTPAQLSESSPTVRLRGLALMGSVTVIRQPPPGTPRKFLGTY